MVRVLAVFATQNHGSRKFRMPELAMGSFSTGRERKARRLQISDELADFSRHESLLPAPAPHGKQRPAQSSYPRAA